MNTLPNTSGKITTTPWPPYVTEEALRQFIRQALQEDVGEGDHSTLAAVPVDLHQRARLLVKAEGILAGVALAGQIFHYVDDSLRMEVLVGDGVAVQPGDVAFTVQGPARAILTAERLVLNCMQRMSGIATKTRQYLRQLEGTHVRLLDTRKTTPNFRLPEKWAVAIGGGQNHRYGLYDMIMLKDNHVDYAGGITEAITAARAYLKAQNRHLPILIETRTLDEVREALATPGVDRIMLDNMSPDTLRAAVALIGGRCATEATGGITEAILGEIARTGVDYISAGALTHSARSLDMSLKAY